MERSKGTREVFTPVLEKVRVMQCVTEPHWADLEKETHNYGGGGGGGKNKRTLETENNNVVKAQRWKCH